ncbi:DUF1553 domain-containing protein [Reichenbachiella sp. MALMAid0571]|uniref:DUF1553 domain-containing protein n=1 Tax=Reichenbachiella sp. MALMAid0571 TaxID=3143939 RepID=UPI0032DF5587
MLKSLFLNLTFIVSLITLFTSCSNDKGSNSSATSNQKIPQVIDFNYHVKPILSDKCFACHGPDLATQKGDLRLDTPEGAFETILESGDHPIVPGDLSKSVVYAKITSKDPEAMMPPPESNLLLTEYEIKVLKKWIEQGAEYKPHWAFSKPEKVNIPNANQEWANNEIDQFIAKKLETIGLKPSPEAGKEQLIRRVTFDLIGLSPKLEEINNFIQDDSPEAYEKVVDRLLASPHYGERMASEWLDVSRYADSHGYQDDRPRTMWPWRDWVISAYNKNMPYDDFVTWQLAGDLLPDATYEQKLASGFNRNHAITQEGGVIEEEYLTEYAADRVQTFGTAFIGLTVQCARCHDHKYDPISQKEFYQLFAFFNNNKERGQISYSDLAPAPHIEYENIEFENEIAQIKSMLNDLEQKQQNFKPEVAEETLKQWYESQEWKKLEQLGLEAKFSLDFQEAKSMQDEVTKEFSGSLNFKLPAETTIPSLVEGKFDKALKFDGTNTLTIGDVGDFEYHEDFSLGGWIKYSNTPEYSAGILSRRNGEHNRSGYGLYLGKDNTLRLQIVHKLDELIEIKTKIQIPKDEWVNVYGTYDGSGKASGTALFVNGKKQEVEILSDNLKAGSILVGTQVTVGNWMIRAANYSNMGGFDGAIDEISIYSRELSPLEVKYLYDQQPKYDQQVVYETYIKRENQDFTVLQKKLDSLRAIDITIPNVMVMEELDSIKPAYILARGVYSAHGERVNRGTPEMVLKFSENLPQNRLGLAMWLFDEQNPLTGRVIVNRYWQMLFGKGLVSTPEDFGNQGALPSHPELLDWLAIEFRHNNWDIKKLVKLMVMSATYRQSSTIDSKKHKLDSENTYLARGPYKKLTAEMIRDQALASSGLLNRKIGGKWVKPYQPAGIWKELANQIGENKYRQGHSADLYRRSIYTYWKRTIPVPSMLTFDASERAMCTVKRQTTSTPLQSLVLLNDPQYIEASRVLSERLIETKEDNPTVWIENAFKSLVSRNPSSEEEKLLMEVYQSELQRFKEDDSSKTDVLKIGESAIDQGIDQSKLAALTIVVSTILNLDEAKHS